MHVCQWTIVGMISMYVTLAIGLYPTQIIVRGLKRRCAGRQPQSHLRPSMTIGALKVNKL